MVPLLAPVRWAERAQARDQVFVAERGAAEVRRQIAVAAAEAYLAIIAERRVLESNTRARDNARAHFEYAKQRFEGGVGSRLNALRAQQELSGDEARVEDALLAVRRAQEALGVLIAAEGRSMLPGSRRSTFPRSCSGPKRRRPASPVRPREAPGAGCWSVPTSAC